MLIEFSESWAKRGCTEKLDESKNSTFLFLNFYYRFQRANENSDTDEFTFLMKFNLRTN